MPKTFSQALETWLNSTQPKNLDTIIEAFGEKSFYVIIMLFMALPALPLPTGGLTHVLEIIVMLLALQQIAGLKAIWVPNVLAKRIKLDRLIKGRVASGILKWIVWLETKSTVRGRRLFTFPLVDRLIGLLVLLLTIAAFLSPPFSFLDTLPCIGTVLICLAILFEDTFLLLYGIVIGYAGVFIEVFFAATAIRFIKTLL